VIVHALLDGRDTPPRSAVGYIGDLERRLGEVHPGARIGSVAGRYFAMDRDQRWERVERGYDAIVHGVGQAAGSATEAVQAAYERSESDEFVTPSVVAGVDGAIRSGDAVVHCNFRADRARELTHALVDPSFGSFDRASPAGRPAPDHLLVVTMTGYEAGLPVEVAFPPQPVRSLAQACSEAGWRQLHLAETEKYAHVTYFFNGGVEPAYPGEERTLIPSLKVATYDLAPEMRASAITDALVEAIWSGAYDFIIANYANPDMVGHTGDWQATLAALGVVDDCLGRVVEAVERVDHDDPSAPGALLAITADHGNADELRNELGEPVTAHSLNPVPFMLVGRAARGTGLRDGVLADVAPTLLQLARLPAWDGLTGSSRIL
jgi:2,3-bisphosphoglycerate-independent phosphoglycerate mutase